MMMSDHDEEEGSTIFEKISIVERSKNVLIHICRQFSYLQVGMNE
jgi:hypothetical protein